MKYRDNRRTLADSLATEIEVDTIDELVKYLNTDWKWANKTVNEIKVDYYAYDSRIDWDTYIVTAKLSGETEFWVMGFTNGKLE
jgi:hypothetical protein